MNLTDLPKNSRIVVAMSGGVDSSTAAAWLANEGFDVIGISLQVWDYSGHSKHGTCCAPGDFEDARRVAEKANFPYYVLDFEEEFRKAVIDNFVEQYAKGRTPNPCVDCNNRVKFTQLFDKAMALGADFLATGHYAIKEWDALSGKAALRRSADHEKDQSYFLFGLSQEQLSRALFPLGAFQKGEVRGLAKSLGLHLAEKDESQDICFVPGGKYADFVEARLNQSDKESQRGPILRADGTLIGWHEGIYRYTIGQRKGLGLPGSESLFVIGIDPERNAVVVGTEEDLYREACIVHPVNWMVDPRFPLKCEVQIRYRHKPVAARVSAIDGDPSRCLVEFEKPERAVTPGQVAVFYSGDVVLGGGWIDS